MGLIPKEEQMRNRKSQRAKLEQSERDKQFWFRNYYWCNECSCAISKCCFIRIPTIHYQEGMEIVKKCILCAKGV